MELKKSIKEPQGLGDIITIIFLLLLVWFILSLL